MTPLLPSVVLALHDVTVHASLGILLEVRKALGVAERVGADAACDSDRQREHERQRLGNRWAKLAPRRFNGTGAILRHVLTSRWLAKPIAERIAKTETKAQT